MVVLMECSSTVCVQAVAVVFFLDFLLILFLLFADGSFAIATGADVFEGGSGVSVRRLSLLQLGKMRN